MLDVRIGRVSFNRSVLQECETLTPAQERFSGHDKAIVKRAYYEAKPQGKKKKAE